MTPAEEVIDSLSTTCRRLLGSNEGPGQSFNAPRECGGELYDLPPRHRPFQEGNMRAGRVCAKCGGSEWYSV